MGRLAGQKRDIAVIDKTERPKSTRAPPLLSEIQDGVRTVLSEDTCTLKTTQGCAAQVEWGGGLVTGAVSISAQSRASGRSAVPHNGRHYDAALIRTWSPAPDCLQPDTRHGDLGMSAGNC
ncbi:hypothetical protein Bbelb_335700 [Branchiostoma belcheri]|nr:hypothetical protein Bbelb_335700 [Branchiostoma belcheri]